MQEKILRDYSFFSGYVEGLNRFLGGCNYRFILKLNILDLRGRDFSVDLIKEIFKKARPTLKQLKKIDLRQVKKDIFKYGYLKPITEEAKISGEPTFAYPSGPVVENALDYFVKYLYQVVGAPSGSLSVYEYIAKEEEVDLYCYIAGFNYVFYNKKSDLLLLLHGEECD